jgi:hypothetical protein
VFAVFCGVALIGLVSVARLGIETAEKPLEGLAQ